MSIPLINAPKKGRFVAISEADYAALSDDQKVPGTTYLLYDASEGLPETGDSSAEWVKSTSQMHPASDGWYQLDEEKLITYFNMLTHYVIREYKLPNDDFWENPPEDDPHSALDGWVYQREKDPTGVIYGKHYFNTRTGEDEIVGDKITVSFFDYTGTNPGKVIEVEAGKHTLGEIAPELTLFGDPDSTTYEFGKDGYNGEFSEREPYLDRYIFNRDAIVYQSCELGVLWFHLTTDYADGLFTEIWDGEEGPTGGTFEFNDGWYLIKNPISGTPGEYCVRSNKITHNQSTSVRFLASTPKIRITLSVSSESSDRLYIFNENGESLGNISGSTQNRVFTITVREGSYVEIRYSKDGSVDTGNDCGYIHNICFIYEFE